MKKLDEITIADIMPDSISGDREVSATARAIDPQLKVVSDGVDLPLILASIDTLSAGVLEHLAAQYDLTAWDSAWPIGTKRAVLKTAIADKRKKGTRGAVQRAIEAVAPLATITEWWQKTPKGTPHTFEIDVLQDGEAVDAETVADVIAQVNDSKPVRCHFTFSVGQRAQGNMYLSGVIRTIAYARVRSSGMTAVQTEIDAGALAALRGMNIRRIMEFSHMGDMPEPTPVPVGRIAGGMISPDGRIDFAVAQTDKPYHTVDNITLHGLSVMGGMFTVDNISLTGIMTPMGGMMEKDNLTT
jgi:phage tail P2-like protein